jgi:hypothetical protein
MIPHIDVFLSPVNPSAHLPSAELGRHEAHVPQLAGNSPINIFVAHALRLEFAVALDDVLVDRPPKTVERLAHGPARGLLRKPEYRDKSLRRFRHWVEHGR